MSGDTAFNFNEEIKRAPDKPGVYIFRDKNDAVIYVGKAINLKNRLRTYFQPSSTNARNFDRSKVLSIQVLARSFEYIVTDTELEALVLECNLIKEYMPRYNVKLKDDKAYPYICLSLSEDFPRVEMARKAARDGNKYFGPFSGVTFVSEVVELANTLWPLRRCTKKISSNAARKERPCLNYHIGKCRAPCGGHIGAEEYRANVSEIKEFLYGKRGGVVRRLEEEMLNAAGEMEFEKAAALRDKITAVRRLDEKQATETISSGDHDVIAMARGEDCAMMQVFFIREGKMTGREHYMMTGVDKDEDGLIMQAFLTQFYSGVPAVPKELDVEIGPQDRDIMLEWLRNTAGRKVALVVPEKGDKKRLIELAKKNAEITLAQFGEQMKREKERTRGAAAEIAGFLGLESELRRIEAFDISNVQGYESVASMTVFEDGKPKRSDYRKFKIKYVAGANDYAAMEEAVARRFNRYIKEMEEGFDIEDGKFTRIPDLILVDGGKGQAGIAERVLDALNISIPVCGMVKDDKHRTRGLIYRGTEISPPKTSEGFKLLTRIQDETHRFAVEYHRKLREKAMLRSVLDDIPGIGPERRKALLRFFGSIEGIEEAGVETLMKAEKINRKAAEAVYNFFRNKNGGSK